MRVARPGQHMRHHHGLRRFRLAARHRCVGGTHLLHLARTAKLPLDVEARSGCQAIRGHAKYNIQHQPGQIYWQGEPTIVLAWLTSQGVQNMPERMRMLSPVLKTKPCRNERRTQGDGISCMCTAHLRRHNAKRRAKYTMPNLPCQPALAPFVARLSDPQPRT